MITRITQQTTLQSNLRFQSQQGAHLARMQEQAVSQNKILRPSDDPAGMAKAIEVRAALAQTEQFTRNAVDAQGWLTVADSTLTQTTASLQKIRDLTVQGANDSNGATSKEAIALQLEQIKQEMVSQANTQYLGRSVFAGTSASGVAFNASTYSYNGTPGDSVNRLVGENKTVRVDADGVAAFGSGSTSLFAEIDSLIADLKGGVNVGSHLKTIDTRLKSVLEEQAKIGTRQNDVETAQETHLAAMTNLKSVQSGVEDIDLADVIVQLQAAYNVQEVSLSVLAKLASSPQLHDFL
jgi:flagellar hook-associated protein 3 FlgL